MRKAKVPVPQMDDFKSEVAAAAQEATEQLKRAPRSQGSSQVEWNSRETHVVKGNQYPNDIWVNGPAQIELLTSAYHKLLKLGDTDGAEVKHVSKVRVGRVKGSKTILIRPTDDTDPDGLELKKVGSNYWVNAISVLGPAKLAVLSGYRERFTVTEAPEAVSGSPALQFNMGKLVERRVVASRKKATQLTDNTVAAAPATTKTTTAIARQSSAATPGQTRGGPEGDTSKTDAN